MLLPRKALIKGRRFSAGVTSNFRLAQRIYDLSITDTAATDEQINDLKVAGPDVVRITPSILPAK